MLNKIFNALITDMNGPIAVTMVLYVSVVIVVMLDLGSGLNKARKTGQYRSSHGLRRTVRKMGAYFNMLLVLTVIDGMQIFSLYNLNPQISYRLPLFPILTFAGAMFVVIIELKSIYENTNDKDKGRYQDMAKLIGEIIKKTDVKDLPKLMAFLKTDKGGQEINEQ